MRDVTKYSQAEAELYEELNETSVKYNRRFWDSRLLIEMQMKAGATKLERLSYSEGFAALCLITMMTQGVMTAVLMTVMENGWAELGLWSLMGVIPGILTFIGKKTKGAEFELSLFGEKALKHFDKVSSAFQPIGSKSQVEAVSEQRDSVLELLAEESRLLKSIEGVSSTKVREDVEDQVVPLRLQVVEILLDVQKLLEVAEEVQALKTQVGELEAHRIEVRNREFLRQELEGLQSDREALQSVIKSF